MRKRKNELELLIKLSAAVSHCFASDSISPSVLISTLRNKQIYTSIVRYGNFKNVDYTGVKGKLVVCKAVADTLEESLKLLANSFMVHTKLPPKQVDPVEELSDLLEDFDLEADVLYDSDDVTGIYGSYKSYKKERKF